MKKSTFLLIGFHSFFCLSAQAGNMGGSEFGGYAPSNWTGFYAGLNGEYSWSYATTDIQPLPIGGERVLSYPLSDSMAGGGLGAQVGFNWQINSYPQWMLGLETDIQWLSLSGSTSARTVGIGPVSNELFYNNLHTNQSTSWFGTLRPRIGYLPTDSLLIYGTGGLAYGNLNVSGSTSFYTSAYGDENYSASQKNTTCGWTAGAGLEWAPMRLWSLKLEYLYYDLGSISIAANPTTPNPIAQTKYTWSSPPQLIRLGFNYHF